MSRPHLSISATVFAEHALPAQIKQLIALVVAHVTGCPNRIRGDTAEALKQGASGQQVWVAAGMHTGGAYAHSALALDALQRHAHRGEDS